MIRILKNLGRLICAWIKKHKKNKGLTDEQLCDKFGFWG